MAFRKKPLLTGIGIIVLTLFAFALWKESVYFDRVSFLSPVEYSGQLPIRNDSRGNGEFGTKRSGNRNHEGVDIFAPLGTPVRAAKGGVAFTGEYGRGMGKFVKIKHKNGLVTVYGHLSKIYIRPVQRVRQGQLIGEVGKTGNARYKEILPHLHFEIRKHGIAQDPAKYISR